MSSTDSRFGPSARPFTFYSVITARKVIMKTVKFTKRVRKSVRAESSAYLAAPPKGRACHPREGRASQPYFEDFEALTSSQGVLYLKNSATTIKHLLKPFRKLEEGYSRHLHGFFGDIETFLQRLYDVINFLDSENKVPTHQDVINFLQQRRDVAAALDVTSDQLHGRGRCAPSAPRREEVRSTTGKSNAKRKRT